MAAEDKFIIKNPQGVSLLVTGDAIINYAKQLEF